MLRMFARRMSYVSVPAGQDQVLFGISLPSGSRINGVSAQVKLHVPTQTL